MSDSGAAVPKDLADTPSSPFQPILPSSRSFRRPIVRRPTAQPSTTPSFPTRTSKPFGEIGKEDENDDFDVLSLVSGVSGLSTAEDVDDETVAFMPRVRDLRYRRPVVRKKTLDVKGPDKAGAEKKQGEVEPVKQASESEAAQPEGERQEKVAEEKQEAADPARPDDAAAGPEQAQTPSDEQDQPAQQEEHKQERK